MERRSFIRKTAVLAPGILIAKDLFSMKKPGKVYGHNEMKYVQEEGWGILDSSRFPVKDCHEMVQDKKGRIVLLTKDRKSVVKGRSVSVRVDLGGRRIIKKKK